MLISSLMTCLTVRQKHASICRAYWRIPIASSKLTTLPCIHCRSGRTVISMSRVINNFFLAIYVLLTENNMPTGKVYRPHEAFACALEDWLHSIESTMIQKFVYYFCLSSELLYFRKPAHVRTSQAATAVLQRALSLTHDGMQTMPNSGDTVSTTAIEGPLPCYTPQVTCTTKRRILTRK